MRSSKRLFAVVMTIIMLTCNLFLGGVTTKAEEDIVVTLDGQSKSPSINEIFKVQLSVKGNTDVTGIKVDVVSETNFKTKSIESNKLDEDERYCEVVIELQYIGTGISKLPIKVTYKKNGNIKTYSETFNLSIKEQTTTTPTETDAVSPSIDIRGTVAPIYVEAGSTFSLKVPLSITDYYVVSPVFSLKMDSYFSIASEGNLKNQNTLWTSDLPTLDCTVKTDIATPSGEYEIYMKVLTKNSEGKSVNIEIPTPITVVVFGKEGPSLSISSTNYPEDITKGSAFDLVIGIKNVGDTAAKGIKVSVEGYGTDGILPNYTETAMSVADLSNGSSTTLKIPVQVSKEAVKGIKTLNIILKYKDISGKTTKEESIAIYINIPEDTDTAIERPRLEMIKNVFPNILYPEDAFSIKLTYENIGETLAGNVSFVVEGFGTETFIPNYSMEKIYMGDVKSGKKGTITIPVKVAKAVTAGTKTLTVKGTYTDENGGEYNVVNTIYINVGGLDVESDGKAGLLITNVSQSPALPFAGGNLTMTFYIENNGDLDMKDVKIALTNLSNANFSPMNPEPYQYIESIKAGTKKMITIPLKLSDSIAGGLNELTIQIDYVDEKDIEGSQVARLYVLDVQNNNDDSNILSSKPKIIINNFTSDKEILKAGDVFTFLFDALNTHTSVAADNIKVTITSQDNVFSVTKGSNSFYITKMNPQEVIQSQIELKIKSDCMTKAYPIEIKFEYEYAGSNNNKVGELSEDVVVTEIINLQVIENARPVVTNIGVGYYEMPQVNMPTILSFEFYNMGKSVLQNVTARVEGDFMALSSMLYIGNREAGMGEFFEMEVTPMIEGMAYGNLIISYEDSNGDTIEFSTPFESNVQGEVIFDWGNDGGYDPGIIDTPLAKEEIVKLPIFIAIQCAIFLFSIIIARTICLKLYKRKLSKMDDEF